MVHNIQMTAWQNERLPETQYADSKLHFDQIMSSLKSKGVWWKSLNKDWKFKKKY